MKSGTSTLHQILDAHPEVNISKRELHFFDIDNIEEHNDFYIYNRNKKTWKSPYLEENPKFFWDWYLSNFKYEKKSLVGEDSTTYLASKRAAERISIQEKPIKLLFLLRHPTKRAFSHYNHLVKTGRALYNFEDTLKYKPQSILNRSLYKTQLDYYYHFLPNENIKVILFEDLVSDITHTVKDVADFLGLDFNQFNREAFKIHANKTLVPKNLKTKLYFNKKLYRYRSNKPISNLPISIDYLNRPKFKELVYLKIENLINPLCEKKPEGMRLETQEFLDKYFRRELYGLDELTGKDILKRWFP
ncbi:sulfotransferase [Salegentibacter mishustinae]|nr:sulfotransferase [Salegentibacter mishustinae]